MRLSAILLLHAGLLPAARLAAQQTALPPSIARIIEQAPYDRAHWGLEVVAIVVDNTAQHSARTRPVIDDLARAIAAAY